MKIGIFTECYKPIINGVVNSILGFKYGLKQLGQEVFVFCPTYPDYQDDPKDKNIVHCQSLPLPGKSGYHFIFPLDDKIKQIAKTLDIIHVQHPFIMGDRAADVAKEFNLPIVFTNHTQYEQYSHYIPISKEIVQRSIEWYIKGFSQRVDMIIAPAQGIVRVLKKYGVKTLIAIVPNGIDIARFKKKPDKKEVDKLRIKYGIKETDKVLIFTGRIAEEKNLTFLLKAFAKLTFCHRENPDDSIGGRGDLVALNKIASARPRNDHFKSKLLLVGGGPQKEHFQNLIKELGLENRAIITDYALYQEMPNYLALGDIYVTASQSEVHPLTVIEGLAAGLPAVIVQAPGTGDIVTDKIDGLVAKDNINDFAAKIEYLLHDRKMYKKLSVGAQKTAKKYSIEATTKRLLEVYQKTIIIHK